NCMGGGGAGAAAGVPGGVKWWRDAPPAAAAAARQRGVEVGAIANSLVFATAGGEPVLVLTSGAHRVDTAKVAALLGTSTLRRADADVVRTATGQPIGGVAPVGHPGRLRTLVDVALRAYAQGWAAGGIPHAVFPTTFDELVLLTGGEPADVA